VGEACIHTHTYTHTHTHTHTHIVSVAVHVRERRLGHKAVVSPLHDVPSREYMPRVGWHRYIKKNQKIYKAVVSPLYMYPRQSICPEWGATCICLFFSCSFFTWRASHLFTMYPLPPNFFLPFLSFLAHFFTIYPRQSKYPRWGGTV
jgi:hypothetical protein